MLMGARLAKFRQGEFWTKKIRAFTDVATTSVFATMRCARSCEKARGTQRRKSSEEALRNYSAIRARLGFAKENMLVGAVGVEPTTNGLKGRCSTTELRSYIPETYYKKMIFDACR
jgi:hypothetical protein